MKPIKITILFTILLMAGLSTELFSNPIGSKKAEKIAKNFYFERGQQVIKNLQLVSIKLELYHTKKSSLENIYYIFNIDGDLGYIIISADDDAYPIIAYSFKGSYDSENLPPAFTRMMSNYESQIVEIQTHKLKADENISSEWERLQAPNYNGKSVETVTPLLSTTWSQGTYYNTDCPVDAVGSDGHVPVGCVATAMAQIMKYHAHPAQGTGSHSYNHSTYGTISADFGNSTYDWASMTNNASGYNTALALINFHCGVSVNMNYGPNGSGASTSYVSTALINYFNYAATAHYVNKSDYTISEWEDILINELDNDRPMEYRGGGPDGGHAFVCDGYQTSSYFHFNWGWGGYADGYFYLDNLNPGGYTFNDGQGVNIGIEPSDDVYCVASGGGDQYISDVALGTINNTGTGEDSYTNYTAMSTDLTINNAYNITITYGKAYSSNDLSIWIDWNQDADFDDTDENVSCIIGLTNYTEIYSIVVPNNATIGATTMRIRLKYYDSDCGSPCGTTTYGEVEDYKIIVQPGSNNWLGTNSDWNDESNWSDGNVPNSSYEVTIPTGVTSPVIGSSTNAKCYSITLEENATITISGNLEVEK